MGKNFEFRIFFFFDMAITIQMKLSFCERRNINTFLISSIIQLEIRKHIFIGGNRFEILSTIASYNALKQK